MKFLTKHKKLILILIVASILRFWRLAKVPVSLFGDELDVGYHAYSVLTTSKDYSGNSWPLHFHSLAEWRTPLYLYSAVFGVAIFGISPLGVRFPAAFFGVLGVLGIYLLVKEFGKCVTGRSSDSVESFALLSSLILAFSPWHIQYSRAAFEVTQLLAFLLFGLYFFFKSLIDERYLWLCVVLLTFTPWIYSTAKLFTPMLLVFLFVVWRREILSMTKKYLIAAVLAGLIVGVPIAYSSMFGGGSQRFGYISIFSDPTLEPEIGAARQLDGLVREELVLGFKPSLADRFFHNKLEFWSTRIVANIFKAVSTDFLFLNGDPNLRHSIEGMGQFYRVELVALIFGLIFFFNYFESRKIKLLIAFWLIIGVLPSAITRNGGDHATRLILILPPLVILMSFGLLEMFLKLKKKLRIFYVFGYLILFGIGFIYYQHNYWVHNPWSSERWWHAGYREAVQSIKDIDDRYNMVIFSMAGEPAWIFFAGWYEYPPDKWHTEFPVGNDVEVEGFGKISHTGKYYFGSVNESYGIYGLGDIIDNKTLYLAVAKEIGANLIREPERTPENLKLVKAISYPSGEPAFYLFSGLKND